MVKKTTVALTLPILFVVACLSVLRCASARTISSFQAGQGGWQLGTLAVGNLDDDPQLEIVVPYRDTSGPQTRWFLDAFKASGERLKGFPYTDGEKAINVSPTLYDLDGDGREEILFTCGNRIIALRGDGSIVWSTTISHENYVPDGGYQVVTNGFYWSDGGLWRDRLPNTAQFFSEVSPPIVADCNGDGSLKVVTGWKVLPDSTSHAQDYNPFIKPLFGFGDWGTVGDVWSGGILFCDAKTGAKDFIYHIHQLVESGVAVGQKRTNAAPLVYALNDSDSVVAFDKTKPYGLWGKGMLYKQFGKNQRLQSGSYLKGVDVYPVDIDGDGGEELFVPTTQLDPLWQPADTILDDDGAILWRQWKEPVSLSTENGWLNSACLIPVNPDHDNHIDVFSFTHSYEITYRYWNGVELVSHPGWPKSFYPFLPTPPVVGDIDGDGQEEVIIGTYDPASVPSSGSLYVFALNGAEKAHWEVPGGVKHIPALADVDGDGSIDLVYRALDGRVYIENLGAAPGAHVSWATHRGNMRRDGNRGLQLFPEGTPIVTEKVSGYRSTTFSWRMTGARPETFQIFRASQPEGPFYRIATLSSEARSFRDFNLKDGQQYVYEVRAIHERRTVSSAPFAILSLFQNNLVANSGFEENDNSHWDKWFTGEIPWKNMTGCPVEPLAGRACMEIRLENHGDNSSIKQGNQYGIPDPAIRTSAGKLYSFGGWMRSGGLSQRSEHWLEWNTSRTGDNVNDIPPAPWPVYFTPHLRLGAEPAPWTYMNRVFVMPEGFPNVELRHRFTTAGPATGSVYFDNIFFRELPQLSDPRWQDLLPLGSSWKFYLRQPPANWAAPDFDDGSWGEGQAKFGAGTGTAGIVTPLPGMKANYYFRRRFQVGGGKLEELLLEASATDNLNSQLYPIRLFLNGVEAASSGIDVVSGDGRVIKYFDLLPFADLLHPGENTVAVVVQNGWSSDWDNVAFDLALKAVFAQPHPVAGLARFTSIHSNNDGSVTLGVNAPLGSRLRLESALGPKSSDAWTPVESFSLDASDETQVMAPATAPGGGFNVNSARFYRLVPE